MSDSDESDSSVDEEMLARANSKKKPAKKGVPQIDSEEEETDSELSELEDSPVKNKSRKRPHAGKSQKKKKKYRGVHDFFLEEVDVSSGGEDEESEGDDDADFLAKDDAADVAAAVRSASLHPRNFDAHKRVDEMIRIENEEELEKFYETRYEQDEVDTERFGECNEMVEDIVQQKLLPAVSDPNLWLVKCRLGEEKQAVLQLMRKMISSQYSGTPLQIKSALVKEGLKGYIYIEAYKQTHVKEAIEGVRSLSLAKYNQPMVPIKEMPDVLRVMKNRVKLSIDQWVRIKRGVFRDDLAQITKIEDVENCVMLRLIPRIDYKRMRGALRTQSATPSNKNDKMKRFKRYPQALFDPDKIRSIGGEWHNEGQFKVFEGNKFDKDGFLHKRFSMSQVQTDGVKPSLAELEKFKVTPESVVLNTAMKKSLGEMEHNFVPGDVVQVVKGELQCLQGQVLSIEGNKITIQPSHSELKNPLSFNADDLKKHFNEGDHVKVISGPHENDTGLVIKVTKLEAVIWSDVTNTEVKVAPKMLQLCQERATGVDSSGHYMFGDLVEYGPKTMGVVVRLTKDHLEILSTNGKVVTKKQNEVLRRRINRFGRGSDVQGNQIQVKDVIQVNEGPQTGLQGEIRHITGQYLFCYSRMHPENGGLFAVRSRQVSLRGGSGQSANQNQSSTFQTSAELFVPQSPRLTGSGGTASNASSEFKVPQGRGMGNNMNRSGGQGANNRPANGASKANIERALVGKTVRIIKGPLKGKIGIVKDLYNNQCSIELHSEYKTVLVQRERVAEVDNQGKVIGVRLGSLNVSNPAKGMGSSVSSGGVTPTGGAGATPQTPSAWMFNGGSRTPSMSYGAGAMTPMYGGGQTPHHDGSMTPRYGSQTPRGNADGSQTPRYGAFDPAGATPRASFSSTASSLMSSSGMVSPASSRDDMGSSGVGIFDAMGSSHFSDYLGSSGGGSSSMTPNMAGSTTPILSRRMHSSPADRSDFTSPLSMVSPSLDRRQMNSFGSPDGGDMSLSGIIEDSSRVQPMPRQYVAKNVVVLVPEALVSESNPNSRRLLRAVVKDEPATNDANEEISVYINGISRRISVSAKKLFKARPDAGDKVRILDNPNELNLGQCLSVDGEEGVIKLVNAENLELIELDNLVPYVME